MPILKIIKGVQNIKQIGAGFIFTEIYEEEKGTLGGCDKRVASDRGRVAETKNQEETENY